MVTYQQYEREEFEPRLGYLNQLVKLEVDIHLVMFGDLLAQVDASLSEWVEIMVLSLIKEHLNKNSGKDIATDRLFALKLTAGFINFALKPHGLASNFNPL